MEISLEDLMQALDQGDMFRKRDSTFLFNNQILHSRNRELAVNMRRFLGENVKIYDEKQTRETGGVIEIYNITSPINNLKNFYDQLISFLYNLYERPSDSIYSTRGIEKQNRIRKNVTNSKKLFSIQSKKVDIYVIASKVNSRTKKLEDVFKLTMKTTGRNSAPLYEKLANATFYRDDSFYNSITDYCYSNNQTISVDKVKILFRITKPSYQYGGKDLLNTTSTKYCLDAIKFVIKDKYLDIINKLIKLNRLKCLSDFTTILRKYPDLYKYTFAIIDSGVSRLYVTDNTKKYYTFIGHVNENENHISYFMSNECCYKCNYPLNKDVTLYHGEICKDFQNIYEDRDHKKILDTRVAFSTTKMVKKFSKNINYIGCFDIETDANSNIMCICVIISDKISEISDKLLYFYNIEDYVEWCNNVEEGVLIGHNAANFDNHILSRAAGSCYKKIHMLGNRMARLTIGNIHHECSYMRIGGKLDGHLNKMFGFNKLVVPYSITMSNRKEVTVKEWLAAIKKENSQQLNIYKKSKHFADKILYKKEKESLDKLLSKDIISKVINFNRLPSFEELPQFINPKPVKECKLTDLIDVQLFNRIYCAIDTYGLYLLFENEHYLKMLNYQTTASIGMNRVKNLVDLPNTNCMIKTFVHRAVRGGICNAYVTKSDNVYKYDVNSMYPSIMSASSIPTISFEKILNRNMINEFLNYILAEKTPDVLEKTPELHILPQCVNIEIYINKLNEIYDNQVAFPKLVNCENNLLALKKMFSLGITMTASFEYYVHPDSKFTPVSIGTDVSGMVKSYLVSTDMLLLEDIHPENYINDISLGIICFAKNSNQKLLESFTDSRNKRLEAKKNNNKALDLMLKLIDNAGWGQDVIRPRRMLNKKVDYSGILNDNMENFSNYSYYMEQCDEYMYSQADEENTEMNLYARHKSNVIFGCHVPALGRLWLLSCMLKLEKSGMQVVYCDTDSIAFTCNSKLALVEQIMPTGNKLNQWECELSNGSLYAIAPKLYCTFDSKLTNISICSKGTTIKPSIEKIIKTVENLYKDINYEDKTFIDQTIFKKQHGTIQIVSGEKLLISNSFKRKRVNNSYETILW